MPFCVNCGSEYTEGQKFCHSCGAPLNTAVSYPPQQVPSQPASPSLADNSVQSVFIERNSHIEEMTRMCNYFLPYSQKYNRFLYLQRWLSTGVGLVPCLVIGIILIVIFSHLFLIRATNDRSWISGELAFYVIAVLTGIGLIIAFSSNARRHNRIKVKYQKESDELLDELWSNYISYGPCLLGFEFTIPENLEEIRDLLLSGRANNIRDAVNTMLDDKHKRQLESLAAATAKYAQQAAVNSGITALNSGVAAFSILTKF